MIVDIRIVIGILKTIIDIGIAILIDRAMIPIQETIIPGGSQYISPNMRWTMRTTIQQTIKKLIQRILLGHPPSRNKLKAFVKLG